MIKHNDDNDNGMMLVMVMRVVSDDVDKHHHHEKRFWIHPLNEYGMLPSKAYSLNRIVLKSHK